jgi:protein SCO1
VIARLRTALIGSLVTAVALAACGGGGNGPAPLSGVVRTPKLHVGAVQVNDVSKSEIGTPFTTRAAHGHLLLVFFGYTTCPDICPTTLAAIRAARNRLGSQAARVDLAFVTVDPKRDTPSVLRKFVGYFVPGAHVLRPTNAAQLATAEHAFLVTSKVQMNGSVDHSSMVEVVDDQGMVLVEWPYGIESPAMAQDLRALLTKVAA